MMDEIKNNPMRVLCNTIYDFFNLKEAKFKRYDILHKIYMFSFWITLLFCNNIFHLTVVINIIAINIFGVVLFHGCPLTHLEKKYLKKTSFKKERLFLKKMGILYNRALSLSQGQFTISEPKLETWAVLMRPTM